MHKITRLITESLKGKNKSGHRVTFGEKGSKISVYETLDGKVKTEDDLVFEEQEFYNKTVAIVDKHEDGFTVDDIVINTADNSLDLKSFLPTKLAQLLTLLGIKDGQIPKTTYPQIMNAQDIVNFYGKPVDKLENQFLYDRLVGMFGQGIDKNSNGVIGDGLTPAWPNPEPEESP